MIDWLKKRLSPVKKDSPRWAELAESIQEFWAENFDPNYDVLAGLRSIYTADIANQRFLVAEMGNYFEDEMPDGNIPACVSMRQMELQQKETDVPLVRAMMRLGVVAEWKPLYAPVSELYGSGGYFLADDLSPYGEYFLISRGRLAIDMADTKTFAKISLVRRRVRSVKPLHIVFDGLIYNLRQDVYAGIALRNGKHYRIGLRINVPDVFAVSLFVGGAMRIGRRRRISVGAPETNIPVTQYYLGGAIRYARERTIHTAAMTERRR